MIEHSHHLPASVKPLSLAVTSIGASTAAVLWGLHLSDIGVIVSMLVAFLGFGIHLWATLRSDQRAQEQHDATMELLRNGRGDKPV